MMLRRVRWWQVILPTTFTLIPVFASRVDHKHYDGILRLILRPFWRPRYWFARKINDVHNQIMEYSTTVARSACQADNVTEAFSELLEQAINQPNVTAAIEAKLDTILALPSTQEKVLTFLTKVIKSDEIKQALHVHLADEDTQQRISESLLVGIKRLLPWSAGIFSRAENKRAAAEAARVRANRTP